VADRDHGRSDAAAHHAVSVQDAANGREEPVGELGDLPHRPTGGMLREPERLDSGLAGGVRS
jgi:hypothetical protein